MRTNHLGNLGEALAMLEASRRGYRVFRPMGSVDKFDFVVERKGKLEKVQVKTVTPKNGALPVPTKVMTYKKGAKTNNRSKMVKYVKGDFDWLLAVDATSQKCYFIPASKVVGKTGINIRLTAPRNGTKAVNKAEDFLQW